MSPKKNDLNRASMLRPRAASRWFFVLALGGAGCGLSWDPPNKAAGPLGDGGAGHQSSTVTTTGVVTSTNGPSTSAATTADTTATSSGSGGATNGSGAVTVGTGSSGTGGGNSVCKQQASCEGCIHCAITNDCAAAVATCSANADCVALSDCINQCVDATCSGDCISQHQQGAADYKAAAHCVVCTTCPSQCALLAQVIKCK